MARSKEPVLPMEADPSTLAFRTFLSVAERLGLQVKDRLALLGIAKSTYTVWLKRLEEGSLRDVDGAKLDRIAYVLGIYELAGGVFPDGVAWLTRANQAPVFAGRCPLDRMLDGRMEDLIETLNYLKTSAMGLPNSTCPEAGPAAGSAMARSERCTPPRPRRPAFRRWPTTTARP